MFRCSSLRWNRPLTCRELDAQALHMLAGESDKPRPARHARLFRNGRNQALRIPREFELATDKVIIYREDARLVVEPVRQAPTPAEILSRLTALAEDFPTIADPPTDPEDIL